MKFIIILAALTSFSAMANIDSKPASVKELQDKHMLEISKDLDKRIDKAQALINMVVQKVHSGSIDVVKKEDIEYALVGHIAKLQGIREDKLNDPNMNYEVAQQYTLRINSLLKELQSVIK